PPVSLETGHAVGRAKRFQSCRKRDESEIRDKEKNQRALELPFIPHIPLLLHAPDLADVADRQAFVKNALCVNGVEWRRKKNFAPPGEGGAGPWEAENSDEHTEAQGGERPGLAGHCPFEPFPVSHRRGARI